RRSVESTTSSRYGSVISTNWVSMWSRPNATAQSGICRRRPASWSWPTAIRELPELFRQSIVYARAWTERDLPGRLLPVDRADHFTILGAPSRSEGVLRQA